MSSGKSKTRGFIVALDGPAGAGKSTVSIQLARALKGKLLDTGATFRCVAYLALKEGVRTERECTKIARRVKFRWDRSGMRLLANGQQLGQKIRSDEVSNMASAIGRFSALRTVLKGKQRELAKKASHRHPVVVEGRDIGTVVFPKVRYKFYVTADPKVRAKRRYRQLRDQGIRITLKQVLKKQHERDMQDSKRRVAPLRCAKDAVIVDTSAMEISEVVKFIETHIRNARRLAAGRKKLIL